MPGVILAAISPDNTPHGYNWTFAFPMLLFIIIALILYALFSRPHRRVPGRFVSATPGTSRAGDRGRRDPDREREPGGSLAAAAARPQDGRGGGRKRAGRRKTQGPASDSGDQRSGTGGLCCPRR